MCDSRRRRNSGPDLPSICRRILNARGGLPDACGGLASVGGRSSPARRAREAATDGVAGEAVMDRNATKSGGESVPTQPARRARDRGSIACPGRLGRWRSGPGPQASGHHRSSIRSRSRRKAPECHTNHPTVRADGSRATRIPSKKARIVQSPFRKVRIVAIGRSSRWWKRGTEEAAHCCFWRQRSGTRAPGVCCSASEGAIRTI